MLRRVRKLIKQYRKKYQFMLRVAKHFGKDSVDYKLIEEAWDTTRKVHRGKRRKNGDELFSHERALAIILMEYRECRDAELIAAAFLHDLIEDYEDWTFGRVKRMFGERVARLVNAVTKPDRKDHSSDIAYDKAIFDRVAHGGWAAVELKSADRLHNMLTLWGSGKKKIDKILQTFQFMLPLSIKHNCLWQELVLATTEQMKLLSMNQYEMRIGST